MLLIPEATNALEIHCHLAALYFFDRSPLRAKLGLWNTDIGDAVLHEASVGRWYKSGRLSDLINRAAYLSFTVAYYGQNGPKNPHTYNAVNIYLNKNKSYGFILTWQHLFEVSLTLEKNSSLKSIIIGVKMTSWKKSKEEILKIFSYCHFQNKIIFTRLNVINDHINNLHT